MIKVGITGGIGSGKTVVCQVFLKLGAPVYFADVEAKLLSETDRGIRKDLKALLGKDIYSGRTLDRSKMSDLVFGNRILLDGVNRIIHPKVAMHFQAWCREHARFDYIIQESAILFESSAYLLFDKTVTVTAPEELRIQRTVSRKSMTLEKIKAIMQNQMPEHEKVARSHHVILNDGAKLILPQILKLHHAWSNHAQSQKCI
jgi:dephospho-CoA kinase